MGRSRIPKPFMKRFPCSKLGVKGSVKGVLGGGEWGSGSVFVVVRTCRRNKRTEEHRKRRVPRQDIKGGCGNVPDDERQRIGGKQRPNINKIRGTRKLIAVSCNEQ